MKEPNYNHHDFKNVWGKWRVKCFTCSEPMTAEFLEKFYDKVGIYIGSGLACSQGHKCYAIDRRKAPIIIKSRSGLQPLNYEHVVNYQQGKPTSED